MQGAANKKTATTDFISNGLIYLFDKISYEIGLLVRNPGISSIMKGYASLANDERICYQATSTAFSDIVDNNGNFSACIPL